MIVEFFPGQLIGIFGAGNESVYYTQFGIRAFRIYLCMIVFALVNKGSFIFLQARGKAKESSVLSMIREILFGVGFTVLNLFFSFTNPINAGAYAMLGGLVIVPLVSLVTPGLPKAQVERIFSCYDEEVEVTVKSILPDQED